jgi:drug/metabolite transporter (DMT)-like permease
MKIDLIKRLALGAFVGCFIVMLIMVLISLQDGPQNVSFNGTTMINAFLGSIVVGWGFSLTGIIYEREDIAFPLQVAFQMGIGMLILFIVAIYLQWMPTDMGIGIIFGWIIIACIFAAVSWFGFYIYYYLVARELNKKIVNK